MTDPSTIPGAFEVSLSREVEGVGRIDFESAPAGFLKKDGEPRKADWRAYFLTPEGEEKRKRLPSVSSLLDAICPKPGLAPWSEARGIHGTVNALKLGLLDAETDPTEAVRIVRSARLGADRARDDAADRGLNIHDCLAHYMETGSPPNPADHPESHRGYLQAMTRWLLKTNIEPTAVEQLVCEPTEGFAGRLDLRGRIDGLDYLVDAKTSERGAIWAAAHVQVGAYSLAAQACGDPAPDRLLIVAFAANGEFREMPADYPPSMIRSALDYARTIRPIDAACAAGNRAEKQARKLAA